MTVVPDPSPAISRFSDLLDRAMHIWTQRPGEECVVSLALPLQGVDPLIQLPLLAAPDPFRFLWDLSLIHI